MRFEIVRDIRIFRDMLYPVLMPHIMENNMLLGMLETCISRKEQEPSDQHFSIVRNDEEIVGAIAQTMQHRPVFSLMSAEVAVFALESWLKSFRCCNTLFGPETTMNELLKYLQKKSSDFSPEIERMMSYELTRVKMPATSPAGAMRFAESDDLDLLEEWGVQFTLDCNLPEGSSPDLRAVVRKKAHQSIVNKARTIWEIGGTPVSMAGAVRTAKFGTSVAWVYTPPVHRGKGYASQLVAELSQHLLDHGAPRCLLFTDARNPVSNAIYQRIGYGHACDYLLLKNMNDFCLRK